MITISEKLPFLKRKVVPLLDVGDYITKECLDGEGTTIYELITEYLFVFFVSTECDACAIALISLQEFLNNHPDVSVVILLNTDEDTFTMIKSSFQPYGTRARFFSVNRDDMHYKFRVFHIPRGYSLNKLGQVLAHNSCQDQYSFDKLKFPLESVL